VSLPVSAPVPEIVYRDDDLLIINKPSGLPTTAPSPDDRSLVGWVADRFPDLRAHPTSRLDSPVSGLVTFALSKAANQRLLDARREGTYERLYLGVTLHAPQEESGAWDWPISIDPRNAKLRVAGEGHGQRSARTRYEIEARTPHATLLHLRPETGRTHQLRVHAAKGGAPLFGDHAYGGERRMTLPNGSVVTARRVMLHCARIGFPWDADPRAFEAAPPEDFARIWESLGGVPG
jgi:23S rRNA-/tRNA-specific pseudouridylate synthase